MRVQFASAADVWAWAAALPAADAATLGGRAYRCLLAQASISTHAFTLRDAPGDVPLVIAGIADLAPLEGELWFLGPPSGPGALGARLVTVVRLARAWLDQDQTRHPRDVVCRVAPGHRPGERLAAALGFVREELDDAFGAVTWRRKHGQGGQGAVR